MQRRAAAVNRGRPVARIIVQEWPAAAQLVLEIRQPGARGFLPFVIAPAYAERESIPGRHDDARRPELDVERRRLPRFERLQLIVCVIGPPRLAQTLIELAMRRPQPALRDRRVRVYRTHERDFPQVGGENAEHEKQVGVARRGGYAEARGQRAGDLGLLGYGLR